MPGYAHEAVVRLVAKADERAPGAAVTVALCGHWEHDGPCRWPHHTAASPTPNATIIRTVFVAPEADEAAVRERITAALSMGCLDGPEGISAWSLISQGPSKVTADEEDRATRFLARQRSDG